jgi:DnaJ like chaperone protein
MAKYNKWLGAGAGWIFAGPIGGLIGFAIGALIDNSVPSEPSVQGGSAQSGFGMSLMVLIAAVMKADGKIMRSEIDYAKAYLQKTFGPDDASGMMDVLKNLLNREIPLYQVCRQIADNLDYASRLELMHLLYGIASADGEVSPPELYVLQSIGSDMGVSAADCLSIKAMFVAGNDWAYQVLEISTSATADEIKKAYRQMAVKYHPDKVSHLGEEVQKSANEKIQKVNEAYEKLKKERGFV